MSGERQRAREPASWAPSPPPLVPVPSLVARGRAFDTSSVVVGGASTSAKSLLRIVALPIRPRMHPSMADMFRSV